MENQLPKYLALAGAGLIGYRLIGVGMKWALLAGGAYLVYRGIQKPKTLSGCGYGNWGCSL